MALSSTSLSFAERRLVFDAEGPTIFHGRPSIHSLLQAHHAAASGVFGQSSSSLPISPWKQRSECQRKPKLLLIVRFCVIAV